MVKGAESGSLRDYRCFMRIVCGVSIKWRGRSLSVRYLMV